MLTKAIHRFGTYVHNAGMHQHDCRQACSQWNRQAASIISESEGAYRKNCDTRTDSESVAEGYIILAASIWQQWPASPSSIITESWSNVMATSQAHASLIV